MTEASLFLNTKVGAEDSTVEQIHNVSGVKHVHQVYRAYDLVCLIESPNMPALRELVLTKIRQIPQIYSSITLICMD